MEREREFVRTWEMVITFMATHRVAFEPLSTEAKLIRREKNNKKKED